VSRYVSLPIKAWMPRNPLTVSMFLDEEPTRPSRFDCNGHIGASLERASREKAVAINMSLLPK